MFTLRGAYAATPAAFKPTAFRGAEPDARAAFSTPILCPISDNVGRQASAREFVEEFLSEIGHGFSFWGCRRGP